MISSHFILTCLDDIVLSQSSATTGGHRSLDYIPGAALLGACAAELYDNLGKDAFSVFHAGKVRFGNALPLSEDDHASFPVPLAWHHAKGDVVTVKPSGVLKADAIYNFTSADHKFPKEQQPKQMRVGYVTVDARLLAMHHGFRLKTAIDRKSGAAAESQLFGYESIRAGTRFTCQVAFDDDIAEEIRKQVIESLVGELRIGRSRGAQYGRVASVERKNQIPPNLYGKSQGSILTLWLLSDLVALDDCGQPTFSPKPEWLGLPRGKLLTDRSFMQTRRYSPYHGKRRAYDIERQAIRQGSVLSFELEDALDSESFKKISDHIQRGLGLYREQGLGQAWLNPTLLAGVHPVLPPTAIKATGGPDAAPKSQNLPPTAFTSWLAGATKGNEKGELHTWATNCAEEAQELYRTVARFEGLPDDDLFLAGPSLSQWGRLEQIAKEKGADDNAIYDGLFNDICKETDDQWKRIGSLGDKRISFRDWLISRLGTKKQKLEDKQKLATGRTVALLAETVRRKLIENSTSRSQ